MLVLELNLLAPQVDRSTLVKDIDIYTDLSLLLFLRATSVQTDPHGQI